MFQLLSSSCLFTVHLVFRPGYFILVLLLSLFRIRHQGFDKYTYIYIYVRYPTNEIRWSAFQSRFHADGLMSTQDQYMDVFGLFNFKGWDCNDANHHPFKGFYLPNHCWKFTVLSSTDSQQWSVVRVFTPWKLAVEVVHEFNPPFSPSSTNRSPRPETTTTRAPSRQCLCAVHPSLPLLAVAISGAGHLHRSHWKNSGVNGSTLW